MDLIVVLIKPDDVKSAVPVAILLMLRSKNIGGEGNAFLLVFGYGARRRAKSAIFPVLNLDKNESVAIESNEIDFTKSASEIGGNGDDISSPQKVRRAGFPM